jgi:hypothetical protein
MTQVELISTINCTVRYVRLFAGHDNTWIMATPCDFIGVGCT